MLLSKSFLLQEAEKRSITDHGMKRDQIIYENAELFKNNAQKMYDIFLSHSSLDKRLVLTLVELFNDAGYSVYVDWIEDRHLDRSTVSKETAEVLIKRMSGSRGLAYVATSNATNSKWCPWELGYFDGNKKSRCCVLPVVESDSFRGQEYLGLYPYIRYSKVKGRNQDEFWVYNQGTDEYVILKKWLDGQNPYNHKVHDGK